MRINSRFVRRPSQKKGKHLATNGKSFVFLLTALPLLMSCAIPAPTEDVPAPILETADTGCVADASWFPHGATERPNDATFESTSNCVFHQWAWQMFLWLTQEDNGQPRFLNLQSPESLLGMQQRGIFPRKGKRMTPQSYDEFLQAGTDGIFVDHSGRAVYYSQYINKTFADFITSNDLTNPETAWAFPPETTFPITGTRGSLELKASWKVVHEGEDVADMFTLQSDIAKLVNRNGRITTDVNRTERVTLALVGFHIAGVVNEHPEMIWATFEHKRNAPNVPVNATADTIVSDKNHTFYSANTPYKDCNVNPANSNELTLDEATQTLAPITEACRRWQFGNRPDPNNKSIQTNDRNIETLNKSVHARLRDVWKNYYEVGAIWFNKKDGLQPGLSLADDELLTGSLKLSNSTIETFTQTQSVMDNCFRCHNTQQEFPPPGIPDPLPAKNLNISHAFQNIYFWSQKNNDSQSR